MTMMIIMMVEDVLIGDGDDDKNEDGTEPRCEVEPPLQCYQSSHKGPNTSGAPEQPGSLTL